MTKLERHSELLRQMHETYIKKNHDYGDAFAKSIEDFGPAAALVRISDKYYRLSSLLKSKEALVKDETICDTLLDLANYCVMTVMEVEK